VSLASALLVRWLHVLAVAVALGGAVVAWATLRADGRTSVAAAYEWLLWGALGVAAMTGVGNLGALAPAVPGPDTRWGVTLAAKLVGVIGFLALSVARTGAVVRARAGGDDAGPASSPVVLGRLYAATAGYLVALVALAEVLAHG
jgi:hypothetical protein